MFRFLEQLMISIWNRLQGRSRKLSADSASALSLGFRVIEGEVTKQRITVSLTRRATHMAALGKTGSGKSYWIRHCVAQDIAANRGGFIIDFHGDLTPFVLGAIAAKEWRDGKQLSDRVIVISPSDTEMSVGLNPLEGLATDFRRSTEFAEILEMRFNLEFGARTEELLRNSIVVLSANGLTLLELPNLLTNDGFRAKCLETTPNAEVREYFESRYGRASEPMKAVLREPVLNKTSAFTADPRFRHIVGQQSTFSMKDAMDRHSWVIANLPKGELGGPSARSSFRRHRDAYGQRGILQRYDRCHARKKWRGPTMIAARLLTAWDGLVGSAALIALIVLAFCVMVRVMTLGDIPRHLGAFVGIVILLVMLPAIIISLWSSMSFMEHIGSLAIGTVFAICFAKSRQPQNPRCRNY